MHLSRASLIDREAKLHEEALQRFKNNVQNVIKAVACAHVDHIRKDLTADPDDVLEVFAPLLATLKVLLRLDRI